MLEILKTFFLAMTPIGELRLAIPVALTVYRQHWLTTYITATLGTLLPAVLALLLLGPISNWLSNKSKIFQKFFAWLFRRARNKIGERTKKYSPWALALFVAIPLPITGAWTGSVAAFLFKIPLRKALLSIAAGTAIAGIIVSLITFAGIAVEQLFGWKTLFIIIFIIFIAFVLKFKIKHLKFIKKFKT